jgi:hypothetical protein
MMVLHICALGALVEVPGLLFGPALALLAAAIKPKAANESEIILRVMVRLPRMSLLAT